MGLDLRALLAQSQAPSTIEATTTPPTDKLADKTIRIVLDLGPAETFGARAIQGVIGASGELPFFIYTPKSARDLNEVLAKAYAVYADVYEPPTGGDSAEVDSPSIKARPLATAKVERAAQQLDIF